MSELLIVLNVINGHSIYMLQAGKVIIVESVEDHIQKKIIGEGIF
jgi:hypothetical protein